MDDLFGFEKLFPLELVSGCNSQAAAAPRWAVWVMVVCRREGELSKALLLQLLASTFRLTLSPETTSVFFCYLFSCCPFLPPKSVLSQQKPEAVRRSTERLYHSMLVALPKLVCVHSFSFEVQIVFGWKCIWNITGFDGPVYLFFAFSIVNLSHHSTLNITLKFPLCYTGKISSNRSFLNICASYSYTFPQVRDFNLGISIAI